MPNKMSNTNKWTKEDLMSLYKGKNEEGLDFKQIGEKIKKSSHSVKKQYRRVDWTLFLENPDSYMSGKGEAKKWDQIEMAKLFAFTKSGKSYDYIAKEMGRSFMSIESKDQSTNWQAWETAVGSPESPKDIEEIEDSEEVKRKLSDSLVQLCRHDKERLKGITEEEFLRKINLEAKDITVSFKDIKVSASETLDALGYGNLEDVALGKGNYIIIGDSHGKHTKTAMFQLLREVEKVIKPVKIIHIGHILDDDNDISHEMGKFVNDLIIVAKTEELKLIQEQRNKYNFKYEIVRGGIQLGNDLNITNQELMGDYVKSSLNTLDSHIFEEKVIVNNHKLEWAQKCSEGVGASYIVSPGGICEKHISENIKQIDFEDRTVKQVNYSGFSKYRRMKHMYEYWNQGLLVVQVDEDGNHTITPCIIRNLGDDIYATSYFDKIITNTGAKKPDKKIFITADMHSPNQDDDALEIQEQICKDYKPDVLVNIGDSHDYRSLNHHDMGKGIVIMEDILDESAQVHYSLKRMATWAKEKHLIYGNHERFADDFVGRYPQFKKYLDFEFICDIKELGYKLVDLKDVLKIETTKFIHGDMTMYGQAGNKLEKAARTFKGTVFVGHMHYPAIRFGAYSIGLSGKLDQRYNEPNASTWVHGFGLCNHYKGFSFPTTIAIVSSQCLVNNKNYVPINPKSWKVGKYSARIVYQGI
jgi:hypothetical protein